MTKKYARVIEHERRGMRDERVTMAVSYGELKELEAFARANNCKRSTAARWLINDGLRRAERTGEDGDLPEL